MNRDSVLSVYSDARAEYTKQLCVFLVPAYFQFFTDLLEKSKASSEPKKVLWQFQNYLNEIHDWNMEKVNNEINIINTNCGCDYMEDLLTAVFIAHTKVLTAIRLSSNNKKIEINIPKIEHFLFKVLCETSKMLWGSTYLFRDGISGVEKQQNYRNIEQLINEGILQAVRSLVPVKSILKDFVNNEGDDKEDKEDKEDNDKEDNDKDANEKDANANEKDAKAKANEKDAKANEKDANEKANANENANAKDALTEITIPESISFNELPASKQVDPEPNVNQTIIINEKPSVKFGEFNALFDSDHPTDSDMIYDSEEFVPDLEIMTGESSLLSGTDFDNLDDPIKSDEYEVLV